MTSSPTLIVIPTLNEAAFIGDLLTALIENTKDLNATIVIADGGSTDKTVGIVQDFADKHDHIHYLHNDKKIQSTAINLTVEKHGDDKTYLIRMDAHSQFPDDYCQMLINEAKKIDCASVVTPMNTIGETPFQQGAAAAQNSKLGNGGSLHRSGDSQGQYVDHGHHSLMRIDAFRAIGGYDETFSHNEDAELDKRLTDAGYKIWLTTKTSSTYYPRKTIGSLFKQYKNYGHGRCKTLLKHKMKPRLRQMAPVVVFPTFIFALFGLNIALFGFAAWLFLCLGYGVYLGIQTKNKNILRYTGLSITIIHFAWSVGFWQRVFEHTTRIEL